MTTPDVIISPAETAALDALERQRSALLGVGSGLLAARDSMPGRAQSFWVGIAERAQADAVRRLVEELAEAKTAIDGATSSTSSAIWELNAHGR